ncbi:MAG: adenylate kinase family protein [Rhabdochlamydiaceae bacterium]
MQDVNSLIPSYDSHYKAILLFGPPGSGKGTQGHMLSQIGNHYHLSSGDVFRSLDPGSPAGKLFHHYSQQGNLLPDEITLAICKNYIQGLIATNRFHPEKQSLLLDGIPRTLNQAKILANYVTVTNIIVLEVKNLDNLIQRLKKRAIIQNRADDIDEQVLRNRMEVYMKETANLLSFYPKEIVSYFNAEQSPLCVLKDILTELADIL